MAMNPPQPSGRIPRQQAIASCFPRSALMFLLLSLALCGKQASAQQKPKAAPPGPMIPAKINRAAQSATGEAQPAVPGEEGKDEDDAVLQRMEWFYRQRAFPLPHIPAGARLKAFDQM